MPEQPAGGGGGAQASHPIGQPHLSSGAGVHSPWPGRGAGHGSGMQRGHSAGGGGGGGGGAELLPARQQPHMLVATQSPPVGHGVPGGAGMHGMLQAARTAATR